MKLSKKPVSDNELLGKTALKCQRSSEITPTSEDCAALLQSLQERRRILERRAVLLIELEQVRARASAKLRAAADRRYCK